MKIVYMGTPQFAVPSFEALIGAGHEIQMVITQPDKRGNRGRMVMPAIKEAALRYDMRVEQPELLRRDGELIEELRSLSPDLIVVAAYGQILPVSVLEIPKYGCINVHGSLLPAYRGASPMQAAIRDGLETTGVTIMKMEKGLDTGDMISSTEVSIKGMDITEVSELLADKGAELLIETIPHIEDGTAKYTAQNDEESSYASIIRKSDGRTDFDEPADVLYNKIRAYCEWPTLYSYLGGLQVKFYKAEPLMDEEPDGDAGVVSSVGKNDFVVNCSSGKLRILELQLQGKKRMAAGDFLRGRRLEPGERFTGEADC